MNEEMRTAFQFFGVGIRKYQRKFASVVAIIAVGLWILVPFVALVSPWIAIGFTLTAVIVILGMVLDHLIAIRELSTVRFYPNQDSANNVTLKLIGREMPSEVQLIEYSSRSITEILKKLKEVKAKKIELLICDPNHTITHKSERDFHSAHPKGGDRQKDFRICQAIHDLATYTSSNHDKIRIRCYRTPGSLRGGNFGDKWIEVGWYTYDERGDKQLLGSPQIWGDKNPVITAPIASLEGQILKSLFDPVFKKLWDEQSIPLSEVCDKCKEKERCLGSEDVAHQWLQKVSENGDEGHSAT